MFTTTTFTGAYIFNLQMFAEGGAAGGEGGAPGAEGAPVAGGQAAENGAVAAAQESVDLDSEWKDLIKGKFKSQYQSSIQSRVKNLHEDYDKANDELKRYKRFAEGIADIRGYKDASDIDGLLAAITKEGRPDVERRAFDNGISEEQQRFYDSLDIERNQLKRERDELRAQVEKDAAEQHRRETIGRWYAEADELKQKFPDFDLDTEIKNPAFGALLSAGFPVENAYRAVHQDEIMADMLKRNSQNVEQKTINNIRASGLRPVEGAAAQGAGAPSSMKVDPSKLSLKEIEEINRRAALGEVITFR